MAIGTNAAIWFYGGVTTLTASALIGDNLFSASLGTFTNSDDATHVAITADLTMDVAADDFGSINIYLRALNTEGSNDDEIPEVEYPHNFLCNLPVLNTVLTLQRTTDGPFALPIYKTSSIWEVYVENKTGDEIDTAMKVYLTPMSLGPHA